MTDNHPFWSEDRLAFVPAGELRAGERLWTVEQVITQVTRITPHTGPPVPVYNLEVDAEHVYFVGNGGVLVHNSYITYTAIDLDSGLMYVGRASGNGTGAEILRRRLSSHHSNLDFSTAEIDQFNESYEAIRGREQQLIDKFGLPNLANMINGVSDRDPEKLAKYLQAAFHEFGSP